MGRLTFREKLVMLAVLLVGAGYAVLYLFLQGAAWQSADRAARRDLDVAEAITSRALGELRERIGLTVALAARDPVLARAVSVRQGEAVQSLLAGAARRARADHAWLVGTDGAPIAAAGNARGTARALPSAFLREATSRGMAVRAMGDGDAAQFVAIAPVGSDAYLAFAAALRPPLNDAIARLSGVRLDIRPGAAARGEEPWIPDRRMFLGDPGDTPMQIVLSHSRPERDDVVGDIQSRLLIAAATALALAAVMALLFARTLMRPVERLNRAIRRVLAGEFSRVPDVPGKDEMGRLASTFNLMIDGLQQRERRMHKLAYRDALTSLPNRTLFRERLEHALSIARRDSRHVSVMFVDLDKFKQVNDSLGHQAGDALLREVADRVRQLLRGSDSVVRLEPLERRAKAGTPVEAEREPTMFARMGGDEFAILLPGCDSARAKAIGDRVAQAVRRPFTWEGQVIDFGCSVGIATYPDHANDADSLMQTADIAMYEAKSRQLGISIFDPNVERTREAHLSLLGDLRRALELDELRLMFQPKVSLRGDASLMAEALLRWEHPERGLQDPAEFVPFAEKTGFVTALTHWVIDRSLRQVGEWRRESLEVNVAVNVSSRDLVGGDLVGFVKERLERYAVPGKSLTVELTESAMMQDPTVSRACLDGLGKLGIRIAIDDFGTGFATLSQLRSLPADSMKIDRGFVGRMSVDRGCEVIVRSTIELAHSLGLTVVAEGVEDTKTLEALRRMGCDFAQGYLFGKPLHAVDFPSWVRHQAGRHRDAPPFSELPVGV